MVFKERGHSRYKFEKISQRISDPVANHKETEVIKEVNDPDVGTKSQKIQDQLFKENISKVKEVQSREISDEFLSMIKGISKL